MVCKSGPRVFFKKDGPAHKGIDPEIITAVAGELQSFAGLSKMVKDGDKALGDRIHAVEREQSYYRAIGAIALALIVAMAVTWIKDAVSRPTPSSQAVVAPMPVKP